MHYYHFKQPLGPTQANLSLAMKHLGWQLSEDKAEFSDNDLMSDNVLACFEHKHKLHYWLLHHGLNFAPNTVVLDELNLHLTLNKLQQEHNTSAWILKPALLNNGQGIRLFSDLSQVSQYFRQTNRYSGLHVLQQYIEQPLLINNHKFSLRMFVVLVPNGEPYLYPQGYLNVCQQPYEPNNLLNIDSHLTNEHLHLDKGSKNNQQLLMSNWSLYEEIYPQIERQCQKVFTPFAAQRKGCDAYGFLGVDFMLDSDKRLWLLEVNHGPCFPVTNEHPLFETLYQPFWREVVGRINNSY